MARTTRNSTKNSPPALDEGEDDKKTIKVKHEGSSTAKTTKRRSPKKPQENEEDESSDEFVILEDSDEDSTLAKTVPPVQHKPNKPVNKKSVKDDKNLKKSKTEAKKQNVKENSDAKTSPIFAVFGLLIVIVVILFSSLFASSTTQIHTDIPSGLTKLFQDFKNQSKKSDKMLRTRAASFLKYDTSPQPFVVMIAASEQDQFAADCFATKLGKLFVPEPLAVNGSLYATVQSEKAKLEIDEKLQDRFQENIFPTVAIIHNLESLSFDTSMLFYKYCDHDHPRYPRAAIIFTVTLPPDYPLVSSTGNEVADEGMVETYLTEHSAWAKDNKFDENKMGALLSRITDTVIVIRSESEESLQSVCHE